VTPCLVEFLAVVPELQKGQDDRSLHLSPKNTEELRLQKSDQFGDDIPLKPKKTLRIGFQNIGGFPVQQSDIKNDYIRIGISNWDFDIFGIAETNLDWRFVMEENKLWARTREWWEHLHISQSHNTTFPATTDKQFGGTALFTINDIAHRVVAKGYDDSRLGRWSWTTL
jgi:hypothetical protein